MSEKNNGGFASVSLCDLVLVTFIVLKLTGVIAWSWLWVLAPLWIPLIIYLVFVIYISFIKRNL